jgi:uncharacterized protein (DUF58 family)
MIKHLILLLLILVSLTFTSSKSFTSNVSSAAQTPVARTVKLGAVNPATATIGNTNQSITLSVTIVSSADVPTGGIVTAKVDFLEVSNFGGVAYSVTPSTRTREGCCNRHFGVPRALD